MKITVDVILKRAKPNQTKPKRNKTKNSSTMQFWITTTECIKNVKSTRQNDAHTLYTYTSCSTIYINRIMESSHKTKNLCASPLILYSVFLVYMPVFTPASNCFLFLIFCMYFCMCVYKYVWSVICHNFFIVLRRHPLSVKFDFVFAIRIQGLNSGYLVRKIAHLSIDLSFHFMLFSLPWFYNTT